MKVKFANAASADVLQQLQRGIKEDKLSIDLSTTHLRNSSVAWIMAAYNHCSGLSDSIKKGYENAGTLQAFSRDFQREVFREIDREGSSSGRE